MQKSNSIIYTGSFTFWISLSLRPKTETKPLNFGLSPEFNLTNHARRITAHSIISSLTSLLISPYSVFMMKQKNEVIFVHQNLISNRLAYLVHAKSTGECISFGFSDRSVRSTVSAKRSANR